MEWENYFARAVTTCYKWLSKCEKVENCERDLLLLLQETAAVVFAFAEQQIICVFLDIF